MERLFMHKKNEDYDEYDDVELSDPDSGCTYNPDHGVIMLTGDIDRRKVDIAIRAILAANMDLKYPYITLIIKSPGGSVDDGFSLIDMMRASVIPVQTVALGECSSAALMIAMAGNHRMVSPNCSVLSHQFSAAFPAPTKRADLKAREKDFQMIEDRIVNHYVGCTGLPASKLKKTLLLDYDVFLDANEAIKYNLFDELFENMSQIIDYSNHPDVNNSDTSEDTESKNNEDENGTI